MMPSAAFGTLTDTQLLTAALLGVAIIMVLTFLITRAVTKRRIIGKIDFMSDALLSGERMFRYSDGGSNRRINKALNRLRTIFQKETDDFKEKELYFSLMLDNVMSGVIVLDGENVSYSNIMARSMLGMSAISNLRQVERIHPSLADAFRRVGQNGNKDGQNESKAEFQSERGKAYVSMSACETDLHGHKVRIVTFNDVTRDMENNETESWTKLVRVLTHEIMNTVTPIASLSSSLSKDYGNYSPQEVISSLSTIASSSRGLIDFVQSYRSLTHITAPVRKAFYFKEVAEDAINMAGASWPEANVAYTEHADDIILYADKGQIAQVVNNLVKNAIQAGARNVNITADIDKQDRVVINVANDGEPISPESQSQIFVPFYTTKGSNGTGVGLSLARQMIRLNGGTIKLASSTAEGGTVFTMIF